ncbi:MAG: DUF4124 domain-containing protein [Cellvibrionaceae bacterium]
MNYPNLIIIAIVSSCLISTSAMAAKNYYKWTDAEGVTHYSAQRPNNTDSEAVSIKGGRTVTENSTDTKASQTENKPKPAGSVKEEDLAPGETVEVFEKDLERCKAAKDNLKLLQTSPRIRTNNDGEVKFMSDDERATRINESQQAIEESC